MKDRAQHPARLARRRRLPDRADRQVAERLRRARRPRRGPEGLRHLARPARRLRLRLLQLRDEQRRQAEDLGRRGVRAQARRVREDRGRRPSPTALAGDLRQAERGLRPRARTPTGAPSDAAGLLARRDRRDHRAASSGAERKSKQAVLHLVGARRAAPRGRRDDADGPPGPRPAPGAALRGSRASSYTLPRPPSFNEADLTDKPSNMTDAGAAADRRADRPARSSTTRAAPARCCAVDDHVAEAGQDPARDRTSCKNTLIVFVSDNGWLQGEHRIPGDKFLPYEESLRVPLIVRGPGVPDGPDGPRPGLEHRLRADAARRRRTRRPGARWTASRCCRRSATRASGPSGRSRSRRSRRCSRATSRSTPGTGPTRACAPTATPTSSGPRPASRSSTTAQADPYQLDNVAGDPAYAAVKADLAAKLEQLADCARQGVQRAAMRIGATVLAIAGAAGARGAAPRRRPPRRPDLHDARYCEILELRGERPERAGRRSGTRSGSTTARRRKWDAFDAGALAAERGRRRGDPQRPAPLPDGLGDGRDRAPVRTLRRHPDAQGGDDPDPHRRRARADALHRPRRSSATTPGAGRRAGASTSCSPPTATST